MAITVNTGAAITSNNAWTYIGDAEISSISPPGCAELTGDGKRHTTTMGASDATRSLMTSATRWRTARTGLRKHRCRCGALFRREVKVIVRRSGNGRQPRRGGQNHPGGNPWSANCNPDFKHHTKMGFQVPHRTYGEQPTWNLGWC